MIQDSSLEYNQQWEALANAGIGGPVPYVAPTTYTATPATTADPYLTVVIEGSKYTDMMAATHRPLLPVFYSDQVYYSFAFDINSSTQAIQALEFEASYCDANQYYYNNSMQLSYVNPVDEIQAYVSPTNVWANTGIIIPKFAVGVATPVVVNYLVNTVAHTMSTLSLSVNGTTYPLPAEFQQVPGAIRSGWAAGVYVQFQLDLPYAGGTITNKYSNISVNWQ